MLVLALLLTTASAFAALAATRSAAPARGKKIIEMGWDEPDTRFLRRSIARMQTAPFDGCVFHVMYRGTDGRDSNFTWRVWGRRAFTDAELAQAREDLRVTRFGGFRHSYLRVNVTPGDVGWFDDEGFSAVVRNLRLAAALARVAGVPGVMLDTEQYETRLWTYARQPDAARRSWPEYAEQVRRRGRQAIEALQAGYPGLTVFLTFGYSLPWHETTGGQGSLSQCANGMLAPFLDGMLDGARGNTRFVDGYELSYAYRDPGRFRSARVRVRESLLTIVANPEAYRARVTVAFGIWLDHDWRTHGWHAEEPERNYFPPGLFSRVLTEALEAADEYVWVYSETPRWWDAQGAFRQLPSTYVETVRRAQRRAHSLQRRS